jgi:uncharacterized protein YjaZ
MKIFYPYGSKERLFEMLHKVNKSILVEAVLNKEQRQEIIEEFVQFVQDKLNMENIPEVELSYDEKEAQEMKSFGLYTNDRLLVVAANRNLADILRTIAHELIHHKQRLEGRVDHESGKTGSDIENEANALAGVIMREFAQIKPIIFE